MDKPTQPTASQTRQRSIWRHSIWFFIILSLIIHISGFGPKILEELIPKKEPVKITAEELQAQLQEEEEEAREMLVQETRNMLRHELEESFESISSEMDQPELDQLWEEVNMDIELDLAELEAMMEQQDYDMEAFAEQYTELSAEMYKSTADHLKEMLREELKKATLEQVQEHTIDKLAGNLDKRMEKSIGATEERRLEKAAVNDTKRREREQVQEAKKKKEPKPEFNQEEKVAKADIEAREALKFVVEEDVKKQIQEEFDQTLEEKLAPESAQRIMIQANRYLEKFDMAEDKQLQDELLAEITKTVLQQVPEKMKDKASELALERAEAKLQLDQVEAKERDIELDDAEKAEAAKLAQAKQAAEQADQSDEAKEAEEAKAQEAALAQAPPPPPAKPDPLTEEVANKPEESRQAQVQREVSAASKAAELGDMTKKMEKLQAKLNMMEKAELMAEFHESGRSDAGDMASIMAMMGQEGPNQEGKMGPGVHLPFSRPMPGYTGRERFNAEVFQKLLEMSRARNEPDAAYADIEAQADQLVSKANLFPEQRDALLIDPRKDTESKTEEPEETRTLQEPDFQPLKFGFATMASQKPVIDGVIGEEEWDLERVQYAQWLNTAKPVELPESEGIPMYIMWDPSGLYLAADVPNPERHTPPHASGLWAGDSIEVWLDTSTARGPLMKYYEAIQMFFSPYGTKKDPNVVAGYGHGNKMSGMPNSRGTYMRDDADGLQVAIQERPGGYTVELYMPHGKGIIKGPAFKAGKYLGFQVSFNYIQGADSISWVLRGHHTWERPDTWGDLLLLGSDAELSFYQDEAMTKELDILSPGEPVWVKVQDPDMNLDARYKDQVVANAIGSGGYEQLIVLGETEPNSGTFVGGINTNNAYAGLVEGSVPVEPGTELKLIYIDQRRDYGESNKTLELSIPLAWPTLRFGQNAN